LIPKRRVEPEGWHQFHARARLEKPVVAHVGKKPPEFDGPRRYILAFTRVCQWCDLSQTNPLHTFTWCFFETVVTAPMHTPHSSSMGCPEVSLSAFVCISHPPTCFNTPVPSSPCCDDASNIWRPVRITKPFSVRFGYLEVHHLRFPSHTVL
jgi:hypothetical protein